MQKKCASVFQYNIGPTKMKAIQMYYVIISFPRIHLFLFLFLSQLLKPAIFKTVPQRSEGKHKQRLLWFCKLILRSYLQHKQIIGLKALLCNIWKGEKAIMRSLRVLIPVSQIITVRWYECNFMKWDRCHWASAGCHQCSQWVLRSFQHLLLFFLTAFSLL